MSMITQSALEENETQTCLTGAPILLSLLFSQFIKLSLFEVTNVISDDCYFVLDVCFCVNTDAIRKFTPLFPYYTLFQLFGL